MAGMGLVFMFLVGLSIHFEKNITLALSLFILALASVATFLLYLRAHNGLSAFL